MARHELSTSTRLSIAIAVSSAFFVAELIVGFRTRSLALIADAFHYVTIVSGSNLLRGTTKSQYQLNDLIAFIVALMASRLSERKHAPASLAFGWQRAKVLGAFFNGAFLMALGLSIFLQAIERFITPEVVQEPRNVLIVGCTGLLVNVVCILAIHDHGHHGHNAKSYSTTETVIFQVPGPESPKKIKHNSGDLGINAVVIHIFGDVLNNVGVIAAALIMMLLESPKRFYVDPAVSIAIAVMISCSAIPLTFKSGHILLGSTPPSVQQDAVVRALREEPGVVSVHDLFVWQLSQDELIASTHVVMLPLSKSDVRSESELELMIDDEGVSGHGETANERLFRLGRCFHDFGVHKVTLQIEDDAQRARK